MTEFTVDATNLDLPYGARFTYKPRFPIETGAICLLTIGRLLTIGGYYRDVAGCDWIVQPDRMIRVTGRINVEIWGPVTPLPDHDGPDRTIQLDQIIVGAIIFKLCDLVAPLITT
jgi:hypothetical protein